jgi:SagB-type dehydrogenase family enzyme
MNRRDLLLCLAAAASVAGCAGRAPSWIREGSAQYAKPTALPAPVTDGPVSLERAIGLRRSVREYRSDPLPVATIGQLRWAGQGITSADGKRAAPSAGALYPLELYVVSRSQVSHYLPDGHRIEVRATADLRGQLRAAAYGQAHVAAAPVVIVVAALADRTRRKYGPRASAFVEREAGHAAQNILLMGAALGRGTGRKRGPDAVRGRARPAGRPARPLPDPGRNAPLIATSRHDSPPALDQPAPSWRSRSEAGSPVVRRRSAPIAPHRRSPIP